MRKSRTIHPVSDAVRTGAKLCHWPHRQISSSFARNDSYIVSRDSSIRIRITELARPQDRSGETRALYVPAYRPVYPKFNFQSQYVYIAAGMYIQFCAVSCILQFAVT